MNTGKLYLLVVGLWLLFGLTPQTSFAQAVGQLMTVDSTADSNDINVGDGLCADASGHCTLRAAVQEANANPVNRDAIVFALPNPSVIDLTQGELVISGNVAIIGPGARRLTLEASPPPKTARFRIFRITSGSTNTIIRGLKVQSGDAFTNPGGGFLIEGQAHVTLSDLFLYQNVAGHGGGIENFGTVNIYRSLFVSNAATSAGAIENAASASATIVNSTFYQNVGNSGVGAIASAGNLLLVNNTFEQNTGTCASVCNLNGTAQALNNIFGRDSPPGNSLLGTFVSLGNNIVVDPTLATGFTDGVNNDQVSDPSHTVDPMLGSLANNGGETDTLALLNGSPAIDKGNDCVLNGNCPVSPPFRILTDQRGFIRLSFFNPTDIGAFEAGTGVGSSGFLAIISNINRPPRYLGSIAVLTNAVTNEKHYFTLSAVGVIRVSDDSGGVCVLELKAKRAGIAFDPILLDPLGIPFFSFRDQDPVVDIISTRPALGL